MREFLREKGVNPSWHLYFIKAMGQMTFGLFATLIIGLIIKTAGEQFGIAAFLEIGELAMDLYGAAIGAAVALALGSSFVCRFGDHCLRYSRGGVWRSCR